MEIEAKLIIPDAASARRLQQIEKLDAFILDAPHTLKMRDTFFDTRARALRAVKYVLRVRRRSDSKIFITLKTPAEKIGAVHRRPEIEIQTDFARTPKTLLRANLPARIYQHIAPFAGDAALHQLFSITQTRHLRAIKSKRRIIGEWSVDRVEFRAGARRQIFYELEIELKKSGTEQELEEMIAALQKQIPLDAQPQSKFARALEFMQK